MYIADLHIHSRYSRATSKDCTPEYLDLWARRKGIHIVGTGDFTHPAWRQELEEKLTPAEEGLYVLKEEYRIRDGGVPGEIIPRFVITGEISSIYKKNGRVRKVHSLILLPGLEDAQRISAKLEQIGNIHSDGRPILGLDCHDLLEIVLELCPSAVYVPAHIWTPHFSLFGAFSGFDTVEECFEDLTPYIHAMETGLSSDPPMNWRVSALDKYQLISNSDAHSPAKLGREANLLDCVMSYEGLSRAIQTGEGLSGTIEFFPEEGKYHMDGHRKCSLCLTPSETVKYGGKCPVCGRKLTIGVSHRVEELADREEGYIRKDAKGFESLVPLPEVISASVGSSAASGKVRKEYEKMLFRLGAEFEILRNLPLEDIRRVSGGRIAEGIRRLRGGEVERIPGFDGEYGIIRLFCADELNNVEGQMDFFGLLGSAGDEKVKAEREENAGASAAAAEEQPQMQEQRTPAARKALNPEQKHAVVSVSSEVAVKAGPGTGKTKTLTSRIRYLLENRRVSPSEITAVTFTNQAAEEMRQRLGKAAGKKQGARSVLIGTFHAICLEFLKDQGEEFCLAGEGERKRLAALAAAETGITLSVGEFLEQVSRRKSGVPDAGDPSGSEDSLWKKTFENYENRKKEQKLYDFDDLLLCAADRFEQGPVPEKWKKRFRYLLVDEFQDINPVQQRLIRIWSRPGRELFVIGDPDQAIYGFRGADPFCFERMAEENRDLEMIRLRENYRSTPQIINAACALWNTRREKNPSACAQEDCAAGVPEHRSALRPNRPDGAPVRLVKAGSPMGEAVFIAKEINRMAGGIGMLEAHQAAWKDGDRTLRGFGDIAVLCRTNRQADLVETCLRKESIPYIRAGREEFLQDDTVQGSLAFFRYLENPENTGAAQECAAAVWKLEWNAVTEEIISAAAETFRPLYKKKKPVKFVEEWVKEMQLESSEAMRKLLQMTVFYGSMQEFMDILALGAEGDLKRASNRRHTAEAVTVMTIHGSKGLEFPAVFIYGVNKGSIPLEGRDRSVDPEEERRLFYVGMTRAEEELILTTSGEPSDFIRSLDNNLVQREDAEQEKKKAECRQMSLFEL